MWFRFFRHWTVWRGNKYLLLLWKPCLYKLEKYFFHVYTLQIANCLSTTLFCSDWILWHIEWNFRFPSILWYYPAKHELDSLELWFRWILFRIYLLENLTIILRRLTKEWRKLRWSTIFVPRNFYFVSCGCFSLLLFSIFALLLPCQPFCFRTHPIAFLFLYLQNPGPRYLCVGFLSVYLSVKSWLCSFYPFFVYCSFKLLFFSLYI